MVDNTMVHIALDLELEQPKTNRQTPDSLLDEERIIQVGYVFYKLEPTFEIIERVCREVNIGVPLSKFIQQLTGITNEQIANGTTLEVIFQELVDLTKKHSASRIVKQWGGGDMDCIKKELPLHVGWPFGRSGCNIKHMYQVFAEANGKNTSGGLKKSMSKCGLKFEGGAHNALVDAINTAKMHDFIYRKLKIRSSSND